VPSPTETFPAADRSPGRRRRRRILAVVASVLGGLVVIASVAAALIHVPYVIESPGDATPLDARIITVSGAPTHPHRGLVYFLTVQVTTSDPNLYRYLFATLSSTDHVVKRQDVLGCASYAADARLNTLLMQDSQDAATEVALTRVGYPVAHTGDEALIVDLMCHGPSDRRLEVGDVITAVDGQPVSGSADVGRVVRSRPAHAVVAVTVRRGDRSVTVSVPTGSVQGRAFLGIFTQTLSHWRFPVNVRLNTRMVGGPSAGLAFTLALINDLSSGDLTGGRRVAATGAIFSDGAVGPVGGVALKAATARRNHASLLLVPAGSEREARANAPGVVVVPVRTIDDALAALRREGGAPLPARPPGGSSPGQ
jgi:Lon-like protease